MTGAAINFNAATVAPSKPLDPIPSGWYNARVTDSKMEPTSKNDGQLLKLELTILDGPFAGRKVFDRLNLVNNNPTAVQIAYETLSAICHATGVIQLQQSTAELHNIPLKVKVKLKGPEVYVQDGIQKQSDGGNEVKGYDHINSDRQVGPSGPVTAGGVAGAPAGVPPWAGAAPAGPAAPVAPAQVPAPAVAPPVQFQPPVAAAQPWQQPVAAAPVAPAQPFVPPAPVVPAAPTGPIMLPAAGGASYEQFKANGWTDEAMIAQGFMAAPQPVAPVAPQVPVAPVAPQFQQQVPTPAAPATGGVVPPWQR